MIVQEIIDYNAAQSPEDQQICNVVSALIAKNLPEAENKIWHRHPVWFLEGNPVVGYSKEKKGLRLMFWSGASFDEPLLSVLGKQFKDASVYYTSAAEINNDDLQRWLQKARDIQWDYKHIVKRKGVLERLK
jgi:uncharacterized protein YdhG (YjbR/CyaY superfamily)